jgi:hypothetical protein
MLLGDLNATAPVQAAAYALNEPLLCQAPQVGTGKAAGEKIARAQDTLLANQFAGLLHSAVGHNNLIHVVIRL